MSREVMGTRADPAPPADVDAARQQAAAGPTTQHLRSSPGAAGATHLGDRAGRATGVAAGERVVDEAVAATASDGRNGAGYGDDGADDPDEDTPTRGDGVRPGRRRTPAIAALAGALVGGVLAVGVSDRAMLREAQSTASVHAWVEPASGRSSADTIGMAVRLVNTGDAAVTVLGAAMHGGLRTPGPVDVVLTDEVLVRPGTMASVGMDAQADCEGPPLAENSTADGRLQLRLRTADGREQLVQPPTGGISLTSADIQESFCGQTGLRLGLSVAQLAPTPGGELSMSLLNDSSDPIAVEFTAPDGTRIVAEPPLPLVVEEDRRVSLVIDLEVTSCTADAQRVRAGDFVQLVLDGRIRRGGLDSTTLNAWYARKVALACS